jgi:hypothetical protein
MAVRVQLSEKIRARELLSFRHRIKGTVPALASPFASPAAENRFT